MLLFLTAAKAASLFVALPLTGPPIILSPHLPTRCSIPVIIILPFSSITAVILLYCSSPLCQSLFFLFASSTQIFLYISAFCSSFKPLNIPYTSSSVFPVKSISDLNSFPIAFLIILSLSFFWLLRSTTRNSFEPAVCFNNSLETITLSSRNVSFPMSLSAAETSATITTASSGLTSPSL